MYDVSDDAPALDFYSEPSQSTGVTAATVWSVRGLRQPSEWASVTAQGYATWVLDGRINTNSFTLNPGPSSTTLTIDLQGHYDVAAV
eukprot:SAG31_NODE_22206_length_531_cov_1.312500_1_plen_86_part_01